MSAMLSLQVERIGLLILPSREAGRARGLQEGDRTASGPGPQRRSAAIFRRRRATQVDAASPREPLTIPALHRETK